MKNLPMLPDENTTDMHEGYDYEPIRQDKQLACELQHSGHVSNNSERGEEMRRTCVWEAPLR